MKIKLITILNLILFSNFLFSQNKETLLVSFNNQVDGGITKQQFIKRKNKLTINKQNAKKYKIISFNIYFLSKNYVRVWHFNSNRIPKKKKMEILELLNEDDIYLQNIKVKSKLNNDTLISNNIHLKLDYRDSIKTSLISINSYATINNKASGRIKKADLINEDFITFASDTLSIISYIFSTHKYLNKIEIKVNSNKISNEIKNLLLEEGVFKGTRINFEMILVKSKNGNYYYLPPLNYKLI